MSGLAALLGAISEDIERREKVHPQDMLTKLRTAASQWTEPTEFEIGDVITPRKTSTYSGKGDPAVVVSVRPKADFTFHGEPTSDDFGARYDVRVIRVVSGGAIAPFWVEGAQFERWVAPAETADQQAA